MLPKMSLAIVRSKFACMDPGIGLVWFKSGFRVMLIWWHMSFYFTARRSSTGGSSGLAMVGRKNAALPRRR